MPHTMDAQAHADMDATPAPHDRSKGHQEGRSEVNFLKDLYLFMKKRDTPIERIPHLGFKQIDLYLMYQTVNSLGGYEQVTAQQLWKQVYNTLGGNPRSTSAATCTRRHYEKLLLPFECHSKGIRMKVPPQPHPKSLTFLHYGSEAEPQRPIKRKMDWQVDPRFLAMHRHPSSPFHPINASLSPYVPVSLPVLAPCSPPVSSPFTLPQMPVNRAEKFKGPLQRLRKLSEDYKISSGLSGPLNLIKSPDERLENLPPSSFTAPPPSKSPKFLNTPYPLYSAQQHEFVENNPTEDDTQGLAFTVHTTDDGGVIDLTSKSRSSSAESFKNPSDMTKKPNSPATVDQIPPLSPDARPSDSPRPLQQRMEIEIPLSVFQKWLQLCGPLATMEGLKQLQPLVQEYSRLTTYPEDELLQSNVTFHINPQHHNESSTPEDLRVRKVPSPKSPNRASSPAEMRHPASSHKLPAPAGLPKVAQDVGHFDPRDAKSSWTAFSKTSATPLDYTHSPARPEQPSTGRSWTEPSEEAPPALSPGNSSADPMLQLTKDEVMKLKKIISSSL